MAVVPQVAIEPDINPHSPAAVQTPCTSPEQANDSGHYLPTANNNNYNNNDTYLYRISLFSTCKVLLSIRVLFKETFDNVKF